MKAKYYDCVGCGKRLKANRRTLLKGDRLNKKGDIIKSVRRLEVSEKDLIVNAFHAKLKTGRFWGAKVDE